MHWFQQRNKGRWTPFLYLIKSWPINAAITLQYINLIASYVDQDHSKVISRVLIPSLWPSEQHNCVHWVGWDVWDCELHSESIITQPSHFMAAHLALSHSRSGVSWVVSHLGVLLLKSSWHGTWTWATRGRSSYNRGQPRDLASPWTEKMRRYGLTPANGPVHSRAQGAAMANIKLGLLVSPHLMMDRQ